MRCSCNTEFDEDGMIRWTFNQISEFSLKKSKNQETNFKNVPKNIIVHPKNCFRFIFVIL